MASRTSGMHSADESSNQVEDALKKLFRRVLDTLANTDVFSRSTSPSSFIVYAHNNPEKGVANAEYVDQFIQWLTVLRSRTLSDRSPILPWSSREGGAAAVESIVSNQFCLLSPESCRVGDAGTITSVDKVILCSSPLLRQYCKNPFTARYIDAIQALHAKSRQKTRDELQKETRDLVEKHCEQENFHHVLTELAFVEMRRSQNDGRHGIIPVSLDEDGVGYLPFLQDSDHYLSVKPPVQLFGLHKSFFSLLQRLYTEERERITIFRDCYKETIIDEEVSKAQDHWLRFQTAAAREQERNFRVPRRPDNAAQESMKYQLLAVLSDLPYQDRKDRNPKRIEGSCEWFTNHKLFKDWRDCRCSSFLRVSADSGYGKSVLARYLADDVVPATAKRTTCYFFFKDAFKDQRTIQSAMRCLLYQLFRQRPFLLSVEILRKFEQDKNLFDSFTNLWSILISVASHQDAGEIIIILDALDECEGSGRSQLVGALNMLYSDIQSERCLKFLLTCRPCDYMRLDTPRFENRHPTIRLSGETPVEAMQISQEINMVIRAKVKEVSANLLILPEEEQILRDELTQFPSRTFLWVYLIFDIIRKGVEKLFSQENVRQLPQTVEAAYEKILNRSVDVKKARRLLNIIVAARRPLSLREMAVALSTGKGYESLRQLNLESEDRFCKTIRALCGPFVTVIDSKIYLLHQTAREFLVQKDPSDAQSSRLSDNHTWNWRNSLCLMKSNYILADICITYFWSEDRDKRNEVLFAYAKTNLMAHLREAQELIIEKATPLIKELCDVKSPRCLKWFQVYWPGRENCNYSIPELGGYTPLMFASYTGLEEVVRLLLNHKSDLSSRDPEKKRSALSLACEEGHEKTVAVLLSQEPPTESYFKRLNFKSVINSKDVYHQTPLWHAACHGHKKIVESLVEKGAKLDCTDYLRQTPLFFAAKSGNTAMVQFLLDKGAKIDPKDHEGDTPLLSALNHGKVEAAKLLRDRDARLTRGTYVGALSKAAERKDYEVLLLLVTTIDIKEFKTPLTKALLFGDFEKSKLLLDRGTTVEAQDKILLSHHAGEKGGEWAQLQYDHVA